MTNHPASRMRALLAKFVVPGLHKMQALDGKVERLTRAQEISEKQSMQVLVGLREQITQLGRLAAEQREQIIQLGRLAAEQKERLDSASLRLDRLAFALSDSGHFEGESAFNLEEPATHAAICFTSREASIFVYRAAFMRGVDYLRSVGIQGPVAEFGTHAGFTARCIAELLTLRGLDWPLYLYDSFEGFPSSDHTPDQHSYEVAVNKSWGQGVAAVPEHYPELMRKSLEVFLPPDRLHIIKGFYKDTLPDQLPSDKLSLIHIDCDLYASTKMVLEMLHSRNLFQDGCVIFFDDYNCNRANPGMGERGALADFLKEQPRWGFSPWFAYGWGGQAVFLHDREATIA